MGKPKTLREGLSKPRAKRPFFVSEILPHGGLGTIHGRPKSLKSMATKNAFMQAGDGQMVWDTFKISKPFKSLYIEMEHGEDLLLDSLGKIQDHYDFLSSQDQMMYSSRDWNMQLHTQHGFDLLCEYVALADPDVLILDPWSELHGYNDMQNTEQLALLRRIRSIKEGMGLWIVHHDCKSGEYRQSGTPEAMRGSALYQASDTIMSVKRTINKAQQIDRIRIAFTMRYADAPIPLEMNYHMETDTFTKVMI